jgi:murein DD-endopeptidase MepM/ murein hydrolase activator NlpD
VAISGVEVAVAAIAPRVIGAPLQGDHWLAANGPDNEADHRRALLPISGQSHIAQRFAIDWVRLFDDGRTAHGDVAKNSSYRCYGANVVAVADGTIVDTHDGIPENVPDPVARAVPITPETIGGNYIVLDVGDHNYAFFAHLQPHSLKVRRGDRVRRGQLLALVGNTGNSSEPHLHFHVADRNAGMAAEGIPYALQAFDLEALPEFIAPALATVGNSVGISPDGIAKWLAGPVQRRRREIPMRNAIVRFPDR